MYTILEGDATVVPYYTALRLSRRVRPPLARLAVTSLILRSRCGEGVKTAMPSVEDS
jgi:hypothetical protein